MLERKPRPSGSPNEPAESHAGRDQTPRLVYAVNRGQIVAHGVLDFGFAEHLAEILNAALAEDPAHLVLDLDDVWILDASAARVLHAFQARTAAAGCQLCIVNANGVVRRVLELTGVLSPPADPPVGPGLS
jgi:anti-anti-sigma factor